MGSFPSCSVPLGDDGILRTRVQYPGTDCPADFAPTFPDRVFAFEQGGPIDIAEVARDVVCVPYQPSLSSRGCTFQAPLEAALKAISLTPRADGSSPVSWTAPNYRPPVFLGGSFGHGDDPATDGAFLRPSSVLAVLIVTAVDDCATPNPQIFSNDPPFADTPVGVRCRDFADHLYPVERYVDGLVGLRAHPSRLVYFAITGVPEAVAGTSPATILADPAMSQASPPEAPYSLPDACNGGADYARPGVRMTATADGILAAGGHAAVYSVCSTSDRATAAYDAFVEETIAALAGAH
jgi:hypothetical protein